MTQADLIRQFVFRNFIHGCDVGETVTVRAGDVHKAMGLESRMPAVCSVLDGQTFVTEFNLALVNRSGPPQGSNVFCTFKVLGNKKINVVSEIEIEQIQLQSKKPKPARTKTANAVPPRSNCKICFVSCVGKKRSTPSRTKDLYISDWFMKARRYVENREFQWFILSAEYGLIRPDEVIAPYDKTLNTMGVRDRRDWADKVLKQIGGILSDQNSVTFLAGQRYREFLTEPLRSAGNDVLIPMEGLTIGRQLSWLQTHTSP